MRPARLRGRKRDRARVPVGAPANKPRPTGTNIVDLMSALKQSLATEAAAPKSRKRKSASGQKEMLM